MPKGKILKGPWIERPKTPKLTVGQFITHVEGYVQTLAGMQEPLQSISHFISEGTLRPSYSRQISMMLGCLITRLRELCDVLQEEGTPAVICALHHRLVADLYYMEEQASLVMIQIDNLCTAQLTRSQDIQRHRQRGYDTLEIIIDHLSQLSGKVSTLLDEARFYEKKLARLAQ